MSNTRRQLYLHITTIGLIKRKIYSKKKRKVTRFTNKNKKKWLFV